MTKKKSGGKYQVMLTKYAKQLGTFTQEQLIQLIKDSPDYRRTPTKHELSRCLTIWKIATKGEEIEGFNGRKTAIFRFNDPDAVSQ